MASAPSPGDDTRTYVRSRIDQPPNRVTAGHRDGTGCSMLVVTTNDLPGYRISEIRGLVVGVAARPRNKYTEGIRPLRVDNPRVGEAYLAAGRHEAVERMAAHARASGGNAI